MAWSGRCRGEQVCGTDRHCPGCRDLLAHPQPLASEIPVRRYGTVPDLPDDAPDWEIQAEQRTIGDYGATAVLAAALGAALVAGALIYLR